MFCRAQRRENLLMGFFMKVSVKERVSEMSSKEFKSGEMVREDISGRVNDINKVMG